MYVWISMRVCVRMCSWDGGCVPWWVAANKREVKVEPLFNLLLHTTFYVNNKTP